MPAPRTARRFASAVGFVLFSAGVGAGAELVKAGRPLAVVVSDSRPGPSPKGGKPREAAGEALAVELLVEWVKKITGAELPVADRPVEGSVPIFVGKAAIRAGLRLDDIDSPSREGLRIIVEQDRVLVAGQSDQATVKAVSRFLEELGCRYFMDGPLGEVYPRSPGLAAKPLTITEKPGLLYRNPKGPSWKAATWKAWNGAGGEEFGHAHAWGRYIPKGLFAQHPEYFAMGADGQRRNGDWLCTSNPEVRQVFADGVIAAIKGGARNPSLSPPDGGRYCQCDRCKAQDDPRSIEPSTGSVSMTDRYMDFFDEVARRVAKVYPDSVLSFYSYADYTQPPTAQRKLAPNLCAVIAPIRYCRLHAIGDEQCPSRKQQLGMIDGWSRVSQRLGYYNYMYNLADATLPMFKYTPIRTEFPYLAGKGLTFMTIEVLSNWYIYGPQVYLSLRMAYDPRLDAAAVMDDYYLKFYGPAAAPFMKRYWLTIDEATAKLANHSGGFFGLNAAYSPDVVRTCAGLLAQAAAAAKPDATDSERVAMHAAGFQNVLDYQAIESAMAQGDYPGAKRVFGAMLQRIDGLAAKGLANPEYGTAYLKRFLAKAIEGGLAATAAPSKVIAVLPDRWRIGFDRSPAGDSLAYASPDLDDSQWTSAATFSNTLGGQGIDGNTVLWYRTRFTVPGEHGRLALVFPEVDGLATVFVNGKLVEPAPLVAGKGAAVPRRSPFEADLTAVAKPGQNLVAVRVDNRKINELFLGGILRPVMLVAGSPR
jgi:hypothetical protein